MKNALLFDLSKLKILLNYYQFNKPVPGPRAVEAARGLAGVVGKTEAVGEAAWGTRVMPLCGRL